MSKLEEATIEEICERKSYERVLIVRTDYQGDYQVFLVPIRDILQWEIEQYPDIVDSMYGDSRDADKGKIMNKIAETVDLEFFKISVWAKE